jgi:hypothetical protein
MSSFDYESEYINLVERLYTLIDDFVLGASAKLSTVEIKAQKDKLIEVLTFLREQG